MYRLENIHCIDPTSVLLFNRLHEVVRVGKSIRAEINFRHRSISTTQINHRSRTVKCYFDASSSAIASITDIFFTEDRKWSGADSGSRDYDLYGLLLRKKRNGCRLS